jgi:hypothetical protein
VTKRMRRFLTKQVEIRKFLKIAQEILCDANASVQDAGMASSEPRCFLPLIQQAILRGQDILSSQPVKSHSGLLSKEPKLERILLELQYAEGMLKMLPKAQPPFTDHQIM